MKHFPGPIGKIAGRLFSALASPSNDRSGEARPASAQPLARIFRAAEDAAAATEQLFADARKVEDCMSDIRDEVGLAWQEQGRASKEYYELARGVLLALDDLRALAGHQPVINDLVSRLEGMLREQDIVAIPVAAGDPFSADIHVCGKAEPSSGVPPGCVLAVLSPGYRRLGSGESVVVRPVQVVVSQSPVEAAESKE